MKFEISLALVVLLTGCAGMNSAEQRMASGAAIGAVVGGPIGGVGAVLGAGVGAGVGYGLDRSRTSSGGGTYDAQASAY